MNDDLEVERQTEQPIHEEGVQTAVLEPAKDEEHPDAVELKPGEKYLPTSVVAAIRKDAKEKIDSLKTKADRADALEASAREMKPYVDFLRANPQLLQPRQEPAPRQEPTTDTRATKFAERFELYDRTSGQLNIPLAREILDEQRAQAREAAEEAVAPFATQSYEQQAAHNLTALESLKDADGRPLERAYIAETVGMITQGAKREDAVRIMADPRVGQLLGIVALGLQASHKKSGPKPPDTDPLHIESAGGRAERYEPSDRDRALAKAEGMTVEAFTKGATKFNQTMNRKGYVNLEND